MAKQKKSAKKAQTAEPAPQGLGEAMESLVMAVYGQKQQQTAAALLDASSAVEAAAEDLKLHDRRVAAEHTEATADWLETAAQKVIRMEPGEVTDVLADAADKHPALFIGTAALGGAALVLWLQSINRRAATAQ
ncbi:hypothetical protein EOI86_15370 [Hwanghaeella grinnelliae]|uniref:Uncharacterized protein n=1 Tax=Hwanghaeella grinnelliae TaxID=2500179 RepID=A0A437QPW5_9PROT|nr:hypothetical protein [Hwanghaeella grinnelliae]RVU36566.1 hypothetical protein EOI86_15370 [Hwanghaeella grinnelliae]